MARRGLADLSQKHRLVDGRMPTPAAQRTIDHAEIATLRLRVRQRRLVEPDDYVLVDDLLGLASDLTVALAGKQASLARLRRLAFGPSSDRRAAPAATPTDVRPRGVDDDTERCHSRGVHFPSLTE